MHATLLILSYKKKSPLLIYYAMLGFKHKGITLGENGLLSFRYRKGFSIKTRGKEGIHTNYDYCILIYTNGTRVYKNIDLLLFLLPFLLGRGG